MAESNAVVEIYNTHLKAEAAVKELQRSGFDIKPVHYGQGLSHRRARHCRIRDGAQSRQVSHPRTRPG
jgi:hypothetical protein